MSIPSQPNLFKKPRRNYDGMVGTVRHYIRTVRKLASTVSDI